MEQGKHDTSAEDNNVKRYASPRTTVVFVKAQGVLCQSGTINGLNPREDDTDFWG